MTLALVAAFVAAALKLASALYYLVLRDDGRDKVVYDACVNPGGGK